MAPIWVIVPFPLGVVVLLVVSGLACAAIVLLGMAMSKFYFSQQAWIGIPLP